MRHNLVNTPVNIQFRFVTDPHTATPNPSTSQHPISLIQVNTETMGIHIRFVHAIIVMTQVQLSYFLYTN